MEKIDYKKEFKHLYRPPTGKVVQVDVPTMQYLMIDGEGDPNTSESYSDALEALFAVSFAVKFLIKKGPQAVDYTVMPLEGLWWADDMSSFSVDNKSDWKWTMMIMQPDIVTEDIVARAISNVRKKKNPIALSEIRLETLTEGICAQIMHIGPFSEEGPTVEKVHQYIEGRGERAGKHHEIYLSDIRRADPEKWRTVIRQPMRQNDN